MTAREVLDAERARMQAEVHRLLAAKAPSEQLVRCVLDGAECLLALEMLPDPKVLRKLADVYASESVKKRLEETKAVANDVA